MTALTFHVEHFRTYVYDYLIIMSLFLALTIVTLIRLFDYTSKLIFILYYYVIINFYLNLNYTIN